MVLRGEPSWSFLYRQTIRVVAANTGLPTGDLDMPEMWWHFRRAVEKTEVLDIGRLIAAGCVRPIADDVRAAPVRPWST